MECKYAEDLKASLRTPAADKYKFATTSPPWMESAAEVLDSNGRRQLWYNQLLTQVVASSGRYVEGFGVVVARNAERAARDAVSEVRRTLVRRDELRFSSIEEILGSIEGHEDGYRPSPRATWISPRFRECCRQVTPACRSGRGSALEKHAIYVHASHCHECIFA